MDDYKKIPFDDPDLCVPDLDDFDQMKEFFLDCAAEYFRYLSSDDMEKMLAALGNVSTYSRRRQMMYLSP